MEFLVYSSTLKVHFYWENQYKSKRAKNRRKCKVIKWVVLRETEDIPPNVGGQPLIQMHLFLSLSPDKFNET